MGYDQKFWPFPLPPPFLPPPPPKWVEHFYWEQLLSNRGRIMKAVRLHLVISSMPMIFIRLKNVLWYPFPELFSSEWPETIFASISDLLKYKSIKKIFVILWFCHSVISKTYLTRFLYLNIIQSSPNLAQLFIWVVSRDKFFFRISNFHPPEET